mmetsp:Transcript_47409/g.96879  ORF Transcript_47409/g.96879 Transcript_47409/m.96879 type:complete len:137 (-) Transcript_47409:378-788(-)
MLIESRRLERAAISAALNGSLNVSEILGGGEREGGAVGGEPGVDESEAPAVGGEPGIDIDTEGKTCTMLMGDGDEAGEMLGGTLLEEQLTGDTRLTGTGDTRGGVEQAAGDLGMLRATGRQTLLLIPGGRGLPTDR